MELKESVEDEKSEPRDHYQCRYSQCDLALLATDSLELRLTEAGIKEHTIEHEHIIFRI